MTVRSQGYGIVLVHRRPRLPIIDDRPSYGVIEDHSESVVPEIRKK